MIRETVKSMHLGKVIVWQVSEITHFESSHKYTVAHRSDGKELLLSESMKTLLAQLGGAFIQIRRGMAVRPERITRLEKDPDRVEGFVHLDCAAEPIRIGRLYLRGVRDYFKTRGSRNESRMD